MWYIQVSQMFSVFTIYFLPFKEFLYAVLS